MDEHIENGDAFAPPDMWKKSTLAQFDEDSTDPLIQGFEPLGTSSGFTKVAHVGVLLLIQTDRSARRPGKCEPHFEESRP